MGYFNQLKTMHIKPREFSIPTERKLIYTWGLIDCYLQGEEDTIVPPAVKLSGAGYVTVDGHHRLLVADLFKGESSVYMTTHKYDFFTEKMTPGLSDFMRNDLNYTIEHMFDIADRINHLLEEVRFSDIRQTEEFWFLRDVESAKRFHEEWKAKINKKFRR